MSRTPTIKSGILPSILPYGLLLVFLALLTQTASAAERRVALLIGNASYQHEKKLSNPVNDAELLGGVLKDTLKFDDVRIERNLSVHAMDKVVEDFAQRAKGADSVVFYYSGHGIKSPDRRSFLLPIDARTGTGDAPALDRQAVSAESIRDKLKAAGARVTLLILDACRDGPGSGKSGSKGLARIGGGNGLLVAYATEEDQVAQDGKGRNSPYAEALAQALKRTDLPILEQLDWVADEVHRKEPGQQPTRDGNLRARAYLVSPPVGQGAGVQVASIKPEPAAPAVRTVNNVFKDCNDCPEMVVIQAGNFTMGTNSNRSIQIDPMLLRSFFEPNVGNYVATAESPARTIQILNGFAIGKYEVTRAAWTACMKDRICLEGAYGGEGEELGGGVKLPSGDGTHPVAGVNMTMIAQFLSWLNKKSGKTYRLPSAAEWEYAARAGTTTDFYWGNSDEKICEYENVRDISTTPYNGGSMRNTGNIANCSDGFAASAPVGSRKPNPWGLYDMLGNVKEMTSDCWANSSKVLPTSGTPFVKMLDENDYCRIHTIKGGTYAFSYAKERYFVWRQYRETYKEGWKRIDDLGFRVVRDL